MLAIMAEARAAMNGLSKKNSTCVFEYGLHTNPFFESNPISSNPNNPINDEPNVSSGYSEERNEQQRMRYSCLGLYGSTISSHASYSKRCQTYADKWIDGYQISINFHKGTTTTGGEAK